jgi:hypothetical protein
MMIQKSHLRGNQKANAIITAPFFKNDPELDHEPDPLSPVSKVIQNQREYLL